MLNQIWDWLNSTNGIWTGIVSALIFIFLVFIFFRPWIFIGRHICEQPDGSFWFKMVNVTPFSCMDLNIFLRKVIVKDKEKGSDLVFQMLENRKNPFIYVSGVLGVFREERTNCMQLRTQKDVKEVIEKDGTYVELVISARHGVSGLQATTRRRFRHVDCIKNGHFRRGLSCRVKKNS